MSGAPPGFEELVAAFAESTRVMMERAEERFRQAIPALYGDKLNLGAPGGFAGALPPALGGTGSTTGAPAGETFGTAYTVAGDVALRADGTIATKRW